jgi:molybdenum cofactor biosynthesis protein B
MSDPVQEHRAAAAEHLRIALITVSDSRTLAQDRSGDLIVELATAAGHQVVERKIVPDEPERIRTLLVGFSARHELDAVLLTGGTGISHRDQTYETVSQLLTRPLPGYGELFRMLSYAEIGPAAMLSRAVGGLIGTLAVLVMPGSTAAVRLAMNKLILPELPHIVREARKR